MCVLSTLLCTLGVAAAGPHESEVKVPALNMSGLYTILAKGGRSWSFVSSASDDPATNSMNVAFPNYGTQYYGTAFNSATSFTVSGAFPDEQSGVYYAALTVYNTAGLIEGDEATGSINFLQPEYAGGKLFSKTFKCAGPCIILNREYRSLKNLHTLTPCAFNVFKGPSTSGTAMVQSSMQQAVAVGRRMAPSFQKAVAGDGKNINPPDAPLSKPPNSALPGMFPNANAKYLVNRFSSKTTCMVFTGQTPQADTSIRFYSFMAVKMETTETVASIDQAQMGGWGKNYELFVCRSESDAKAQGYTGTANQFLLEIDGTMYGAVKTPGVVLREINTGTCSGDAVKAQGCGGLWDPKFESPDSPGEISVKNCKAALGAAYPVMARSPTVAEAEWQSAVLLNARATPVSSGPTKEIPPFVVPAALGSVVALAMVVAAIFAVYSKRRRHHRAAVDILVGLNIHGTQMEPCT